MIKNVLLMGKVNSGKSTLANILLNEVNEEGDFKDFEEIFKESRTEEIQSKKTSIDGVEYQIIDTIGVFNDKLGNEQVKEKLTEILEKIGDELSQVLFVIEGKINEHELNIYKTIKHKIFDDEFADYITIVRNRFDHFRNPSDCEEDREKLKKEIEKRKFIIKKNTNLISSNDVIHVSNPSLNPKDYDSNERALNIEDRKESRRRLSKHLKTCRNVYKLGNLNLRNDEKLLTAAIEINESCKQM